MTPKEKRDRLLKTRPFIRPLEIFDSGNYHKDIAILWTAHKLQPFHGIDENLSQERFASEIDRLSRDISFFMAEDVTTAFDSGKGPVGLISVVGDGWRVEPHVTFFSWASARARLKVAVSFLQWIQYKKIGVCVVRCLREDKNLFDHCRDYGVLFFAGKIIGGNEEGDEFLYSIMGKSNSRRKKTS